MGSIEQMRAMHLAPNAVTLATTLKIPKFRGGGGLSIAMLVA